MTQPAFDLILFDLGGVLIDISGSREMQEWLEPAISKAEFWQRWLHAPSVRAFESGRCDMDAFITGLIEDFGFQVTPERLKESYTQWVRGPFPGALELVMTLSARMPIGCLSNTNPCHWPPN
ncbi:MAG: hypothetical protein V4568_16270 [Pseudomonadota bacterium]